MKPKTDNELRLARTAERLDLLRAERAQVAPRAATKAATLRRANARLRLSELSRRIENLEATAV